MCNDALPSVKHITYWSLLLENIGLAIKTKRRAFLYTTVNTITDTFYRYTTLREGRNT